MYVNITLHRLITFSPNGRLRIINIKIISLGTIFWLAAFMNFKKLFTNPRTTTKTSGTMYSHSMVQNICSRIVQAVYLQGQCCLAWALPPCNLSGALSGFWWPTLNSLNANGSVFFAFKRFSLRTFHKLIINRGRIILKWWEVFQAASKFQGRILKE